MSLINKMLQDLDARQNGAREASSLYTKPVANLERRTSPVLVASAVIAVGALAVAGAIGWRYWQKVHSAPASEPARVARMDVPAAPAELPKPAFLAPAPASAPAVNANAGLGEAPQVVATHEEAAPAPDHPAEAVKPAQAKPRQDAPREHKRKNDKDKRKKARTVKATRTEQPKAAPKRNAAAASTGGVNAKSDPAPQGKEESANQKAEAAYRRGLASMQEGYASEAVSAFEQALQLNPRHDAARQTLVGLLIDNRRGDEAMRQLQLALTLDPKQPSMAMLLARLQIERGGSGIDTLMRTLPYVGANAEYHAFLAGALQRQQRHREAIEQYQAALRTAAQNGVWLMGLGISLQAEKRGGEALEAFSKAKASGALNPQLTSFVDGKIAQLSR